MNCLYDQPVFVSTDRDGGRRVELGLSGPTSRSYYFKRVLWKGGEWSSLAELCDGDGLYLGVEAIDF